MHFRLLILLIIAIAVLSGGASKTYAGFKVDHSIFELSLDPQGQ